MRDWLDNLRPGSLLILDEAHHAAPASGAKYAIDSKITRAIRDLAPRFEHRLFLSATPHNGHSNSFSALLELLDDKRFMRGVQVRKADLDAVMVRRLKEDVRVVAGGFPIRRVEQIDLKGLPVDAPELKLAELLDTYAQLRRQRFAAASKREQTQGCPHSFHPPAASFLLSRGLPSHIGRPPTRHGESLGWGNARQPNPGSRPDDRRIR
jgi:hypothetical protein